LSTSMAASAAAFPKILLTVVAVRAFIISPYSC
jgi:hypothetical protein